jgi:hypothetical protein
MPNSNEPTSDLQDEQYWEEAQMDRGARTAWQAGPVEQDYARCDWCGEVSTTTICTTCSEDYEREPTLLAPTLTDTDYRDWEVTVGGEQYLIINEDGPDGDWELRQLVHNGWAKDWQLVGVGTDVDAFLRRHQVVLAAD